MPQHNEVILGHFTRRARLGCTSLKSFVSLKIKHWHWQWCRRTSLKKTKTQITPTLQSTWCNKILDRGPYRHIFILTYHLFNYLSLLLYDLYYAHTMTVEVIQHIRAKPADCTCLPIRRSNSCTFLLLRKPFVVAPLLLQWSPAVFCLVLSGLVKEEQSAWVQPAACSHQPGVKGTQGGRDQSCRDAPGSRDHV